MSAIVMGRNVLIQSKLLIKFLLRQDALGTPWLVLVDRLRYIIRFQFGWS